MNILAVKLLLAPSMILLVSLAARRWGPVVGGILAGLPIIAGPVVLVLGLEQGGDFGREAAAGALGGVISLGIFCFCYAWMSTNFPVLQSIIVGWIAFFTSTFILFQLSIAPTLLFALVIVAVGNLLVRLPVAPPLEAVPPISTIEIIARMIAACCLVFLISMFATHLGSHLSGLLAPFPVAGSILSVFTHHFQGRHAAVTLLRGFTRGLLGMAVFCYSIAITEQTLGFGGSALLALFLTVLTASTTALAVKRLAVAALPS